MPDNIGTMRSTLNAQRSTLNAQRSTLNAQRSTLNAQLYQNPDDTIHVVLCVYDPSGTYSQHAGVTITSIFENTHSKVKVYILHDETLSEDSKHKFSQMAYKYSQCIEMIDISAYKKPLESPAMSYARSRPSIGSLYRLIIPEVISVEKIIYLDCDILFNMDIQELWNIDIQGKALAGALDLPGVGFNDSFYVEKMRLILNGSYPDTYINAGVLIMNLKRIREYGSLLDMAVEWISRRWTMALAADQDAMNAIFAGDIKYLDERFNRNVLRPDMSNCIMHTLWSKPWKGIQGHESDRIYWKMYLRSPWGEDKTPEELVDIFNDIAKPVASHNVSIKARVMSLADKVYEKTVHGIIPFRAIKYIFMNIYCRIKYKLSK